MRISLDVLKREFNRLECKQGDDLNFEIELYKEGQPYILTNVTPTLNLCNSLNQAVIQTQGITKKDNVLTIQLLRDATRVQGDVKAEIKLVEGDKQKYSFTFVLAVYESVLQNANVQPSIMVDIVEVLQNTVNEAIKCKEETEQLIKSGNAATKGDIATINSHLDSKVNYEKQYKLDTSNGAKLILKDFSGYNQAYHPSVLYIPKGFGGYKYWLAMTPFPIGGLPYRDRWECPCIYKSQNGVEWIEVANPLDDLNEQQIKDMSYFSDPHLVYKEETNTLECWYRITDGSKATKDVTIFKKITTDGEIWSDRLTMVNALPNASATVFRSPAYIWDKERQVYRVWYQNDTGLYYNESIDTEGYTWGTQQALKLSYNHQTWHLDVNYYDGLYHMLSYSTNLGEVCYYFSIDGINFTQGNVLLSTKDGNPLYSDLLYRACSLKDEFDNIRVYSTCESADHKAGIILLTGNTFNDLKLCNNKTELQDRDNLISKNSIIKLTNNDVINVINDNVDCMYDKYFTINVTEEVDKNINLINIPKDDLICIYLNIDYNKNAKIKFNKIIKWQNGISPDFEKGYTYLLKLTSFNKGESFFGTIEGKFISSMNYNFKFETGGMYVATETSVGYNTLKNRIRTSLWIPFFDGIFKTLEKKYMINVFEFSSPMDGALLNKPSWDFTQKINSEKCRFVKITIKKHDDSDFAQSEINEINKFLSYEDDGKLLNMINNGNFENGTIGFTSVASQCTISSDNGTAKLTTLGASGLAQIYHNPNSLIGGYSSLRKFFVSVDVKCPKINNQVRIAFKNSSGGVTGEMQPYTPIQQVNEYQTFTCLGNSYPLSVYLEVQINNLTLNDVVGIDNLIIVDLTSKYGEGNEPDIEWCNKNIKNTIVWNS